MKKGNWQYLFGRQKLLHVDSNSDTNNLNNTYDTCELLNVCTCCHNQLPHGQCVVFHTSNYDFNPAVQDGLSNQITFTNKYLGEMICKKCHGSL